MIKKYQKKWLIVLGASMAAVLGGCGRSTGTNVDGINNPIAPGTPGYNIPGQCAPVNGPIPFAGTVYFDSANIIGGPIPGSPQSYGQLVIGGGGTGPYVRSTPTADGVISMNIISQNQGYGGYYGGGAGFPPGPAQVSGTVQLSQAAVQDVYYQIQIGAIPLYGFGQNFQNPYQMPQVCVSQIAIKYGHYGTTLYTSSASDGVYLYINGTQRGYHAMP